MSSLKTSLTMYAKVSITDQRFADILQHHFPEVDCNLLFTALNEASLIYLITTGFHWGPADFSRYIEGCSSRNGHPRASIDGSGIHHVVQYIQPHVHPGTKNQTLPACVEMILKGENTELITSIEISNQLHAYPDKALEIINGFNQIKKEELANIVDDIKSISFLGKYYAFKISGSTHVALYWNTKDKKFQDQTVKELKMALDYWKKYTNNAMKQYIKPMWMKYAGMADWVNFIDYAEKDLEIAKQKILDINLK